MSEIIYSDKTGVFLDIQETANNIFQALKNSNINLNKYNTVLNFCPFKNQWYIFVGVDGNWINNNEPMWTLGDPEDPIWNKASIELLEELVHRRIRRFSED